jgi:hypothetical protein
MGFDQPSDSQLNGWGEKEMGGWVEYLVLELKRYYVEIVSIRCVHLDKDNQ